MNADESSPGRLRRFGDRLRHNAPPWVGPGSVFHLRLRAECNQTGPLTKPPLADALLESARFYHDTRRWWFDAVVLMPDHLHALIAFPEPAKMSTVIGNWKRWHTRRHGVQWQDGYFDHRIRDEGGNAQFKSKLEYILNNPVKAGLCERPEDWPWRIW
ncbi:MAG: transposase [Caulobacteraceae bacterium]|nr:transposase [Caulobacter sp.]